MLLSLGHFEVIFAAISRVHGRTEGARTECSTTASGFGVARCSVRKALCMIGINPAWGTGGDSAPRPACRSAAP